MAATKITAAALSVLHERAQGGASVYSLAREIGVTTSTLSKRLRNGYGFLADPLQPTTVSMPTDPGPLAYIAGLLDAEGCISRTHYGAYIVAVKMTHRPVIEWLAQIGGWMGSERRAHGNRKAIYVWQVHRVRDVVAFLAPLLPYLRILRPAAEAAIAVSNQRIVRRAPRCKVPT